MLTALFACDARSAIHCGDYYSEKTADGTLYNNVWNKNAAGKFAWSQCLEKDAASGLYGWSWNWPVRSDAIFAYPQIKLGTSPWAPSPGVNPEFPLENGALHSLIVEHELQIQGQTEHNVATSLWLTNTPDIGTQPNPSAIVAELMIWTYTTQRHMNPAGAHKGDFNDGKQTWEVWFDKNWSDASGANHNKWIYITFRAKNSSLKAEFDVMKLTRYAVEQRILPAKFYIADIELGTEIMSGSGQAWVKQFKATPGGLVK
jgi:hypothetical protein